VKPDVCCEAAREPAQLVASRLAAELCGPALGLAVRAQTGRSVHALDEIARLVGQIAREPSPGVGRETPGADLSLVRTAGDHSSWCAKGRDRLLRCSRAHVYESAILVGIEAARGIQHLLQAVAATALGTVDAIEPVVEESRQPTLVALYPHARADHGDLLRDRLGAVSRIDVVGEGLGQRQPRLHTQTGVSDCLTLPVGAIELCPGRNRTQGRKTADLPSSHSAASATGVFLP